MRNDHTPLCDFGCYSRQQTCDVLIREAVKTVALHARFANLSRERHELSELGLGPMEARIETCHLRYMRQPLKHGLNRRQIVRLMQRRERFERMQVGKHLR